MSKIKNWLRDPCFCWLALVGCAVIWGCDEEELGRSDSAQNHSVHSVITSLKPSQIPQQNEVNDGTLEDQSQMDQVLGQQVEKLLSTIAGKRYLTGSSEKEMEEIRKEIMAISEYSGFSIAEVATAMLHNNPKADGLANVIARLYPNRPDICVVAYMNGVSGRIRTIALSAYSSDLSRRGNVEALEKMYELVPPSQDRANVASRYVKTVAKVQDLTSAMALVRELDLKEERAISVMDLFPYVRDNRTTLSKDQLDQFFLLAREFGMEQSARASTGAGN